MIAACQVFAPVVTLLLADERVGFNMASEDGDTALMIAVDEGHDAVVMLLLVRLQHHPLRQNQADKGLELTCHEPIENVNEA